MKMYFKKQADEAVMLISETGEKLWLFTSMADAVKSCREFQCQNDPVYADNNDPHYLHQA